MSPSIWGIKINAYNWICMQLFSSCLNYIYAIFEDLSELQIREGIEDNSKMTVLISHQKHMLWPLIWTVIARRF